MTQNNNRVQAGHMLKDEDGVRVYEIATNVNVWTGVESFDQVTAAFSSKGVAVRVVSSGYDHDPLKIAQVVLSREDFRTLLASYRAFERAENKGKELAATATSPNDDFDPFLDDYEVPVNGAGVEDDR